MPCAGYRPHPHGVPHECRVPPFADVGVPGRVAGTASQPRIRPPRLQWASTQAGGSMRASSSVSGGFANISFFPPWLQRRALRTASEKLRNRSSFSANVVYTTPGTRVNRYISRLLEARQMELEMADLDFFTLKYKQAERERKVGDRDLRSAENPGGPSAVAPRPCFCRRGCGSWSWVPPGDPPCLPVAAATDGGSWCPLVPPAAGRVFHQCRRARAHPGRLVWPCLPSHHPAVSVAGPAVSGRGRRAGGSFHVRWRLPRGPQLAGMVPATASCPRAPGSREGRPRWPTCGGHSLPGSPLSCKQP